MDQRLENTPYNLRYLHVDFEKWKSPLSVWIIKVDLFILSTQFIYTEKHFPYAVEIGN